MLSIKGTWEQRVARPIDQIEGREGQQAIITFLDENVAVPQVDTDDEAWMHLEQLLDEHGLATGIGDLAHNHDHYVHGKPKHS